METTGGVFGRIGGLEPMQRYGGSYLIYGLVLGLAIAVIVIVSDYFFPFLPTNPVLGPSAQARNGKVFWKNMTADTENLIVPASLSPTVQPGIWSVMAQIFISDSRSPLSGKYRHILHRGSNPCGFTSKTAGSSGHAGIQPNDLPAGAATDTYKGTGLPDIMNPGLFLDSYTNDLHIFIHTRGTEDGSNALWLEGTTVADLPLNTPITIGISCNGRAVDVYVNCRLYTTILLRGTPYLPKADNQWFGRYCAYPFTGLIKHLELWPVALSSSDMISVCKKGDFKNDNIPAPSASCNTDGWKSLPGIK